MNDAHISAQIEQLEMVLDRLECNVDGFRIELGRLKAGMAPAARPAGSPWQTEDVQPVTEEDGPSCIHCDGATGLWGGEWFCFDCGMEQTEESEYTALLNKSLLHCSKPIEDDDVQPVTEDAISESGISLSTRGSHDTNPFEPVTEE